MMDDRVNRVASLANESHYADTSRDYVDGAPHIKHESLRLLYGQLLVRVFDAAKQDTEHPAVLDLGAGEGSVTLPLLELGANVTAVDISSSQLEALKHRCARFGDRLEIRCEDIEETLSRSGATYDIVVVNSFLHHVPDYMRLIARAVDRLSARGQFFSFQDPLRYDTVGRFARVFTDGAYLAWRVRQADIVGGLLRRIRRAAGIYRTESVHDNAEYHVTRNGVDQEAIQQFLEHNHFDCEVVSYFSTQSRALQRVGAALGIESTFAVVARRTNVGS